MEIFINTIKASQEDLQSLQTAIANKKDRIVRITFFQKAIRIYTV